MSVTKKIDASGLSMNLLVNVRNADLKLIQLLRDILLKVAESDVIEQSEIRKCLDT